MVINSYYTHKYRRTSCSQRVFFSESRTVLLHYAFQFHFVISYFRASSRNSVLRSFIYLFIYFFFFFVYRGPTCRRPLSYLYLSLHICLNVNNCDFMRRCLDTCIKNTLHRISFSLCFFISSLSLFFTSFSTHSYFSLFYHCFFFLTVSFTFALSRCDPRASLRSERHRRSIIIVLLSLDEGNAMYVKNR